MTDTAGEDVAIETLSAQLRVGSDLYVAAFERALAASAAGQLIQPEALDEIVRLEQHVTTLYTLIGVVYDRREREQTSERDVAGGEARAVEASPEPKGDRR